MDAAVWKTIALKISESYSNVSLKLFAKSLKNTCLGGYF